MYFAHIFSSLWLAFSFLSCIFENQMLLIQMKCNLLISCFTVGAFCVPFSLFKIYLFVHSFCHMARQLYMGFLNFDEHRLLFVGVLGFSLWWVLLFWSTGPGAQASKYWGAAQRLSTQHGSALGMWALSQDQGLNPSPLHSWQTDSKLPENQGSLCVPL